MKDEKMVDDNQIVIYQAADGTTKLEVRLKEETVWLNRQQMAELFDRDVKTIGKHVNNALKEELAEIPTVANFATVQKEGDREVERNIEFYSLDMVLSVGYRVKSSRGIQFRIWANRILKEYLVKGYAVNNKIQLQQYNDLKLTVKLLSNVLQSKELSADEATGLLQVISDYTYALDTLDKYDYKQLSIEQTTTKEDFRATYENAKEAISILHKKFGGSSLFGNEKDGSFHSSINTIYQTFDGKELYPSIEEKAAMLLYLVTKNHSFSDGNKRIAAFLFLWFLEKNGILYKPDGTRLIENNTLVALTLMIAESRSEEKDVMVKLVVNLINKNN
ncbi:virulence protein RhuM/Fic/DOC family protein [Bacteroidales bacterium OttesenSCG-928-K03]|nr:virulence protein RhuM/Fic/DOC family protein [Odoribacter sp. OttesenSCG-928-L07]MDL2239649.1 virulence protein RhuM/Fic/DOC family protein [Bacteroidales bacterium OttesenSCG-928-L14]MDL2243018.1 virulence protein RhuM/Fic/DOC family protein [Bacteroidales bacterium OttesenSCG-928-K03]